jgi:hypothetical protein
VRLGAARTVLTAYEFLHGAQSMSPQTYSLLQTGLGVFRDPARTIAAVSTTA